VRTLLLPPTGGESRDRQFPDHFVNDDYLYHDNHDDDHFAVRPSDLDDHDHDHDDIARYDHDDNDDVARCHDHHHHAALHYHDDDDASLSPRTVVAGPRQRGGLCSAVVCRRLDHESAPSTHCESYEDDDGLGRSPPTATEPR
jgi:hypothetical protein